MSQQRKSAPHRMVIREAAELPYIFQVAQEPTRRCEGVRDDGRPCGVRLRRTNKGRLCSVCDAKAMREKRLFEEKLWEVPDIFYVPEAPARRCAGLRDGRLCGVRLRRTNYGHLCNVCDARATRRRLFEEQVADAARRRHARERIAAQGQGDQQAV